MSDPIVTPVINNNVNQLPISPVGILLICMAGYLCIIFFIFMIISLTKRKGACSNDMCQCCSGAPGCCQCLEACTDGCQCGTPTVGRCLDACCPRRNLDFVSIILCQCCDGCCNSCCASCRGPPNDQNGVGCCGGGGGNGPCCSYGDLDCNCACVQPDSVNCCCCQVGSNYNRAAFNEE